MNGVQLIDDFMQYLTASLGSFDYVSFQPKLEKLIIRVLNDAAEKYKSENPDLVQIKRVVLCDGCSYYDDKVRHDVRCRCKVDGVNAGLVRCRPQDYCSYADPKEEDA